MGLCVDELKLVACPGHEWAGLASRGELGLPSLLAQTPEFFVNLGPERVLLLKGIWLHMVRH